MSDNPFVPGTMLSAVSLVGNELSSSVYADMMQHANSGEEAAWGLHDALCRAAARETPLEQLAAVPPFPTLAPDLPGMCALHPMDPLIGRCGNSSGGFLAPSAVITQWQRSRRR